MLACRHHHSRAQLVQAPARPLRLERIHPGGEQREATSTALEGVQAVKASPAGWVGGSGHRASTIAG